MRNTVIALLQDATVADADTVAAVATIYRCVAGSVVDVYRLFDPSASLEEVGGMAELVITSLVVDGIVPGGSLSDRTQVILRVRLPEVRPLLDAYSSGSLLLVDHVS